LPKDNRIQLAVITSLQDPAIPDILKIRFNNDINKSLDAKRIDTYVPRDITSILENISEKRETKDRYFLLKKEGEETGGIKTNNTDRDGRELEEYDLVASYVKCDAEDCIPRDGPIPGVRIIEEPIPEEHLLTIPAKIQFDPAHENKVNDAEVFVSTSFSIFASPGNEKQLEGLYKPACLYAKVSNLAKHLRQFEIHPIAADIHDEYLTVISGENTLGYYLKTTSETSTKVPYLIQKCIAIEANKNGGKDYFFQFCPTHAHLGNMFWFTFYLSSKLSQFETKSASCCVAFMAFLEYHGMAPVHGIENTMHTRFLIDANRWNENIGYFRVSQSGIGFTTPEHAQSITHRYGYVLDNGRYPYFKESKMPNLPKVDLNVCFSKKLDTLCGKFYGIDSMEERIQMMEKLDDLLHFFSHVEEKKGNADIAAAHGFLEFI